MGNSNHSISQSVILVTCLFRLNAAPRPEHVQEGVVLVGRVVHASDSARERAKVRRSHDDDDLLSREDFKAVSTRLAKKAARKNQAPGGGARQQGNSFKAL
jgi:hypothetical protein